MNDTLFDLDALPKGPTREEILDAWKLKYRVWTYDAGESFIDFDRTRTRWCAGQLDEGLAVGTKEGDDCSFDQMMAEHFMVGETEVEACDAIAVRLSFSLCDFSPHWFHSNPLETSEKRG